MTVVSMPILHRPAELAHLLDCSLRHVYDLRLPSYHPTRRVTLIRADDAMRLTGVPLDTYETIDGWPDVAAAARILRVSTRHVHRLMADGTLPTGSPRPGARSSTPTPCSGSSADPRDAYIRPMARASAPSVPRNAAPGRIDGWHA